MLAPQSPAPAVPAAIAMRQPPGSEDRLDLNGKLEPAPRFIGTNGADSALPRQTGTIPQRKPFRLCLTHKGRRECRLLS